MVATLRAGKINSQMGVTVFGASCTFLNGLTQFHFPNRIANANVHIELLDFQSVQLLCGRLNRKPAIVSLLQKFCNYYRPIARSAGE